MHESPTLRLDNITVERGGKRLIADLSLELVGPKLLWVVGGNGIGKTSLLRTCAGLSKPSAGRVEWEMNGVPVTAPQLISFLPSASYSKPGLRTSEEAAFWGASLADTHIAQHGATLTQNLSTGQTKRLSLAKLLADGKSIWILDEPLAGLDTDGRNMIADCLQSQVHAGGLVLIASHAPIAVHDVPTQKLVLG